MILILLINLILCKECKVYNETEIEFEKCNNCSSFKIKLNDILYIGNNGYKLMNIKETEIIESKRIGFWYKDLGSCSIRYVLNCTDLDIIEFKKIYIATCMTYLENECRKVCNKIKLNEIDDAYNMSDLHIIDGLQINLQSLNSNQIKYIKRKYKEVKEMADIDGDYLLTYNYSTGLIADYYNQYVAWNNGMNNRQKWYIFETIYEIEIYVLNRNLNKCNVNKLIRNCECEEKCLTKLYIKNYPCSYDNQSIFCDEFVENMHILKDDCDEIIYKSESSSENIISDDFSDIYSLTNRVSVINTLIFVYFLLII